MMKQQHFFTREASLIRATVIISTLLVASVHAETSLTLGNTPGYPGSMVSLPISVRRATNVVAAQFDVSFNAAKVSAGEALLSPSFSNHVIRSREIAPGLKRVLIYSRSNAFLRTNGFNAAIPFSVSPTERTSSGPLVPSNVALARNDGFSITPVQLNAGTVFVRPVNPLPGGDVQFFLPSHQDDRYLIQATTNLVNWVNILTNVATGNFMDLIDTDAQDYPHRFYRSALLDALGTLGNVTLLSGNNFSFQITGLSGRVFTVQASTNLVDWVNVSTVTLSGGMASFTNASDAAYPTRFFRLQSPQ